MATSVEGWANEGEGVLELFGLQVAAQSAKETTEGVEEGVGTRSFGEGGRS